jgi:DNA-binding transcriptional MocR family regulator
LRVVQDAAYRRHLEALRARLAKARSQTIARLGEIGVIPWLDPRAGMFLWCELPPGVGAASLARAALEKNVVVAPGDVFSLSHAAGRFMRVNVAQCADPAVFHVLREALRHASK